VVARHRLDRPPAVGSVQTVWQHPSIGRGPERPCVGRTRQASVYVGRDRRTRADALIKVLSKPGVVYEHKPMNEIATLSAINRDLPDSRYFPRLWDHGRLAAGRVFLIMSLLDEWPLGTAIGQIGCPIAWSPTSAHRSKSRGRSTSYTGFESFMSI
jgi:hypothetical protein